MTRMPAKRGRNATGHGRTGTLWPAVAIIVGIAMMGVVGLVVASRRPHPTASELSEPSAILPLDPSAVSLLHPSVTASALPTTPSGATGCSAWNAGGAYNTDDVVTYQAKNYTATLQHTLAHGVSLPPSTTPQF